MKKLMRNMLFSGLLVVGGLQLSAQDGMCDPAAQLELDLLISPAATGAVELGVPDLTITSSAPYSSNLHSALGAVGMDVSTPALGQLAVANQAASFPASPGIWSSMWSAVKSGASRVVSKAWGAFSEKPVRNTALAVGVTGAVTAYCMHKYKQNWMDQIEAKITEPNISPNPFTPDRQANFWWAKWRLSPRTTLGLPTVFNSPAAILGHEKQWTIILNQVVTDISKNNAYVFEIENGKLDRSRLVKSSEIKKGTIWYSDGLQKLKLAIEFEQKSLREDLIRLSAELTTDIEGTAAGSVTYFKNIVKSDEQKTQAQLETELYSILNNKQSSDRAVVGPKVAESTFWQKVQQRFSGSSGWFGVKISNCLGADSSKWQAGAGSGADIETTPLVRSDEAEKEVDELNKITKLGDLQLVDEVKKQRKGAFITKIASSSGFWYSKRAAGLYFDVAVAYGRLEALKNLVNEAIIVIDL